MIPETGKRKPETRGQRPEGESRRCRLFRGLASCLGCLLILLCRVHEATAQPGRMLKLVGRQPLSLRSRSGGPIPVEVTLDWAGMGLLEGRLEATFTVDRNVLGRYQSADMALTTGHQTFRMLLPAITVGWEQQQVQAELQFRTRRGVLQLGTRPLSVPDARRRSMTICISDPWEARDARANALARNLRFDALDKTTRRTAGSRLSVQPARAAPEDLPTVPLGYCSYDVVLLVERGFSQLQNRQLKALCRWVEAGGSVCVAPQGAVKPYHVDFLNALTGDDSRPFTRAVDGSITTSVPSRRRDAFRFRSGLGRTVVLMGGSTANVSVDWRAWRQLVCFLWKIRRGAESQIRERGRLLGTSSDVYGAQPIQGTSELLKGLLPRTARLVPMWLIVSVLVLFVLAVGPADYVLLGLIKRRKLTWFVFPVLSITLTLFMVHLSEGYMGKTDHRTSAVFVDVGKGGRVLRTNRYELIFAARSQEATTELKRCFFTPIDHTQFNYGSQYYRRHYQSGQTGPPTYSGRIPTHYSARQQIRKWTPQLNRIFSLEPVKTNPRLNWDALDVSLLAREQARWGGGIEVRSDPPRGGRLVRETLLGPEPFDGHILVMHLGSCHRTGTRKRRTSYGVQVISRCPFERFIRETSTRSSSKGLFSIISQISPTMADNFEDLAILDPTDPNQWLVAVVIQRGDDTIVYRRLYYGAN